MASFFWRAYRDLATCRQPDGPIPWSVAVAYGERKGLDPNALEVFWSVIRQMDQVERQWRIDNLKGQTGNE